MLQLDFAFLLKGSGTNNIRMASIVYQLLEEAKTAMKLHCEFGMNFFGKQSGRGRWILLVSSFSGNDLFNIRANDSKILTLSDMYLGIIWYGSSVFTECDHSNHFLTGGLFSVFMNVQKFITVNSMLFCYFSRFSFHFDSSLVVFYRRAFLRF